MVCIENPPLWRKKYYRFLNLYEEQPICPQFQQTGLLHPGLMSHAMTESNQVSAFLLISWQPEYHFIFQLFNFLPKHIDNKISLLLHAICLNCKSFPFTILLPFTLVLYSLKQTLLKQHSPLAWMEPKSLIHIQLWGTNFHRTTCSNNYTDFNKKPLIRPHQWKPQNHTKENLY